MRVVGFLSQYFLEGPITREVLVGLKTRGLRRRVWYWALDRMERGLVDLTIRWVDKVRSGRMTETLMRILEKLAQAMKTGMGIVLGRELATRASELAVGWGNKSANRWQFELGFCRALARGIVSCSPQALRPDRSRDRAAARSALLRSP
jgi:hypothetical protein